MANFSFARSLRLDAFMLRYSWIRSYLTIISAYRISCIPPNGARFRRMKLVAFAGKAGAGMSARARAECMIYLRE